MAEWIFDIECRGVDTRALEKGLQISAIIAISEDSRWHGVCNIGDREGSSMKLRLSVLLLGISLLLVVPLLSMRRSVPITTTAPTSNPTKPIRGWRSKPEIRCGMVGSGRMSASNSQQKDGQRSATLLSTSLTTNHRNSFGAAMTAMTFHPTRTALH